jgi:hypothetical protein
LEGRDVTDVPVAIPKRQEGSGLEIVITEASASLSGNVVDAHGAPSPGSAVIVFSSDPARWGVASRFVRSMHADADGNYAVRGLPPGTYFVTVREMLEGRLEDPSFLQSLSAAAGRFTLPVGATAGVALTMEH